MNPLSKMILNHKRTKRAKKLASDPNNNRKFIVITDSPYSWHMEWLDEYETRMKETELDN